MLETPNHKRLGYKISRIMGWVIPMSIASVMQVKHCVEVESTGTNHTRARIQLNLQDQGTFWIQRAVIPGNGQAFSSGWSHTDGFW